MMVCQGRKYQFNAKDFEEADRWVVVVKGLVKKAQLAKQASENRTISARVIFFCQVLGRSDSLHPDQPCIPRQTYERELARISCGCGHMP